MIVYKSEKAYKQVRETGHEGLQYGPIHGWSFDMSLKDRARSRSLVPSVYQGTVELKGDFKENSYDVLGKPVDWQKNFVMYRVFKRASDLELVDYTKYLKSYFDAIKNHQKISFYGYVAVIDRDYIIEIANIDEDHINDFSDMADETKIEFKHNFVPLKNPKQKYTRTAFRNDSLRYEDLRQGEAFNIKFKSDPDPLRKVYHPLLEENKDLAKEKLVEYYKHYDFE
jgi:hypothetical protein